MKSAGALRSSPVKSCRYATTRWMGWLSPTPSSAVRPVGLNGSLGALVIGGLFCALSVTGCGESCQSTCFHVYSPAECGVQVSGVGSEELIRNCESECENALDQVGNMGAYNPEIRPPGGNAFTLQNEIQAAAWMDCVWGVECDALASVGGACYGP